MMIKKHRSSNGTTASTTEDTDKFSSDIRLKFLDNLSFQKETSYSIDVFKNEFK
jgi:hypothetical protein